MHRNLLLLLALLSLTTALPASASRNPQFAIQNRQPQAAAALPGTPMCFVETGYCLRGAFLLQWRANGGLAQFGYPVTPELTEEGRTVQYTERARFELHPAGAVRLGLLGRTVTTGRSDVPFRAANPASSAVYYRE